MTATGHAILGTVIAAKFANPALAIPLAFFSHIAADLFPHWDTGTHEKTKKRERIFIESFFDVVIGFVASYVLIIFLFPNTSLPYAFFMILVAQALDWGTAPYYFFDMKFPPFTWIHSVQVRFDNRLDKPWGIINQVLVLVLVILLAKIFS